MKLAYFGLLLLMTGCNTPADADKAEWILVKLKIGNGEVSFPGKPKERRSDEAHQRLALERESGKATLYTAVGIMPVEVDLTKEDAPDLLNDTIDAISGQFPGSTVASDKSGKINDKYPFRDVALELPTGGLYRVRCVLTKDELYQVIANGPKEYVEGDEVQKFIASFKIKEK